MANVRSANTFYIDADSASATPASYIAERGVRVTGMALTATTAGDIIKLYDKSATSAAAGSLKFNITLATAASTQFIDLSGNPIIFPNGIWVDITGTPTLTLVLQGA